jgi:hypothetical protein
VLPLRHPRDTGTTTTQRLTVTIKSIRSLSPISKEAKINFKSLIMAIRHLDASPKIEDFTPLQEHQEQTPATFFGSKPVLYARYPGLTLSASASQLQQDAAFFRFNIEGEGEDSLIKDVEIWVNAE